MTSDGALLLALCCLSACALDPAPGGESTPGRPRVNSGGGVITCPTPGETRACCDTGTMTCAGGEIATFGPCLDARGMPLSCCIPSEFGSCDGADGGKQQIGSSDAGGVGGACTQNELTTCDAGAPAPALCMEGGANNEPAILVGYAPASGQIVGLTGQIKVWVNDEGAEMIAPGEMIDTSTGAILIPGDRTAKAADGYLWEPALYIAPQSAENGGTPHFPTAIKGRYNNTTVKGPGVFVAGMDPPPPGSSLTEDYTTELIWDVASLGLGPGVYTAEFVIHDGDRDLGVGCVTLVIQ